ncbi:MAG: valyl-tRNA synthetase [Verrucomicrobiales bacterium]|nr:valyl-tRNA synthetase [Verrucomicrobiales bacterium]
MAELPKTYDPKLVENKWYSFWQDQNCFTANAASTKPAYSIVIPPPNVTGILHMGHVLNNTIQDILARKARLEGKEVLWLPGTDHAGIATQVMVEKKIRKEEKLTRHDLGREKFVERVWEWKEKHGGIIIDQLKKLGASCDWTRERFTMDADFSRRVSDTFVDLYKKGLIYRGKRMVNWCPATQTALSDEEVNMKPQNGSLTYFRVEVAELPGTFLTIATTRPETIPGDTAVAVNPRDPRYAHLIGKHVYRPLPAELTQAEKSIPIIGDEQVDFEFGTGVLKVTPAHDKADFEIGQRHKLPAVEVINADGSMSDAAGADLRGKDRFEARKIAVEKLTELGALEKEEPYQNNVGFSERADVPIEPRLSEQWFLKYPSVPRAREIAQKGDLKFYPERWQKVYEHWLGNIQDWCISRQLWWGHRIPAWYRGSEVRCQIEAPGPDWVQDPDVLDTWFSSWLWPFATMDEATRKKFYPTSVLVSGPDILFFWVARMVMAGLEYTGEQPFHDVYLTGIVRDKIGRKMSKTLGNSPDPLDLIAKYSADALRFGVMRSAPLGQDVLFDEQHVELGRNFCTKLWNACRFRQMQGGEVQGEINPQLLFRDDKWILLRLDSAIREITTSLAEYKFNEAAQILHRFFWSELCDWYLEATKAVFFGDDAAAKANTLAVLDFILSHALRLFHPFLPFITEELWQGLGYNSEMPENQGGKSIMFAPWPKPLDTEFETHYVLDETDEEIVNATYELVTLGRNLRREGNVPSSKKVKFVFQNADPASPHDVEVMRILLNAEALEVLPNYEPRKGTPAARSPLGTLYLPLDGLIDVGAEKIRLTKEIEKIQTEIEKVRQKLSNPAFTQKVPPAVLEEHQKRLGDWEAKHNQVRQALDALEG